MKKLVFALSILLSGSLLAQDLPQPSPAASFEQRVGLTDFKVTYSRPAAKGRKIFGDLVPYNELWRTGANANVLVELSTAAVIGDQEVEAGKYSLLTIPGKEEWTVIFNTKTDMWGTNGYSKVNDVARVKVSPSSSAFSESFTISIDDLTANSANLILKWEETQVQIPIKVSVQERALKNINDAIASAETDDVWRVYRNAANYHYNNKIDMKLALGYMQKSIEANKESWYSYWLQAEIMAENKMYKEAIKSAKKAIKVGEGAAKEKGNTFGYTEMIESGIKGWSEMKG
jgi:tetratricopeptide (TPR) repeat protein